MKSFVDCEFYWIKCVMIKFKWSGVKIFLLATTALVCTDLAQASELPKVKKHYGTVVPKGQQIASVKKPVFSWQGFYIGIGGGASKMHSHSHVNGHAHQENSSAYFEDYTIDPSINKALTGYGAFGTVAAGYNAQYGDLVLGVFSDANIGRTSVAASMTDNSSSSSDDPNNSNPSASAILSHKVDLLGDVSLGGRIGYLMHDNTLVYVLGGYSLANINAKSNLNVTHDGPSALTNFSIATKAAGWQAGYIIGGGIEFAITDNLSLQTEYRYANYGTVKSANSVTLVDGTASISQSDAIENQTVRAVLNYHF